MNRAGRPSCRLPRRAYYARCSATWSTRYVTAVALSSSPADQNSLAKGYGHELHELQPNDSSLDRGPKLNHRQQRPKGDVLARSSSTFTTQPQVWLSHVRGSGHVGPRQRTHQSLPGGSADVVYRHCSFPWVSFARLALNPGDDG